jgi:endonuclease YncB( thermonuclease family)
MPQSRDRWATLVTAALLIGVLPGYGSCQRVMYDDPGVTNASPDDYSVTMGHGDNLPRNYNYYYNGNQYAQPAVYATPTPYVTVGERVADAPAPAIGYVKPYSDAQYADLVISQMNAERAAEGQPPLSVPKPPAVGPTPAPSQVVPRALPRAGTAQTTSVALRVGVVAQVLDRGVMVTSSGIELRLRGVAFPSLGSNIAKRRELASRALAGLRELTVGKKIYFTIDKPSKGLDQRTLAIVHLHDGTELNRLALESGMGTFVPGDFPDESNADALAGAEADARKNKRGLWSE